MTLTIFKNFKIFNFFEKKIIIRTGKSAILLMKKMWSGPFFWIWWFSSSSGGFWKKEMIFLRNPKVWPIKFYKISHNSTGNSSKPCRKNNRKIRKKTDEFWSILIPKNDENCTKNWFDFFLFLILKQFIFVFLFKKQSFVFLFFRKKRTFSGGNLVFDQNSKTHWKKSVLKFVAKIWYRKNIIFFLFLKNNVETKLAMLIPGHKT